MSVYDANVTIVMVVTTVDGFVTDGPYCINSSGKLFMLCHCYPYHVCVIVTDGEAWLLYSII